MENASKALIIAGSVLIAIVLIAVGIKILSSTAGVTEQVDKLSSNLEVSMFNSQFLQYEGDQRGSQVKALLRLVQQNNTKNSIQIEAWEGEHDKESGQEQEKKIGNIVSFINNIQTNVIYKVEFHMNTNTGYVDIVYVYTYV